MFGTRDTTVLSTEFLEIINVLVPHIIALFPQQNAIPSVSIAILFSLPGPLPTHTGGSL